MQHLSSQKHTSHLLQPWVTYAVVESFWTRPIRHPNIHTSAARKHPSAEAITISTIYKVDAPTTDRGKDTQDAIKASIGQKKVQGPDNFRNWTVW